MRWTIGCGALLWLLGAGPLSGPVAAQDTGGFAIDCQRGTFPNYHDEADPDAVPAGYDGPLFELSQSYPAELPEQEDYPWLEVAISEGAPVDPHEYLNRMFEYMIEGNTDHADEADYFNVQKNTVRPWFHTPWLDATLDGREFVHGLTHELDSRVGLLGPSQRDKAQSWAVGAYNDRGGWAIGQVWCDPNNPDPRALNPDQTGPNSLPDGSAVWKLLFTTAFEHQESFLDGSLEWTANIFPASLPLSVSNPNSADDGSADPKRVMKQVRLIQMDVAVRDDRLPLGWAFGTFAYFADAEGETGFDRLRPVGLMWGNDPGITPTMVEQGEELTATWINPAYRDKEQYPQIHLGWAGRLSGPLDNENSSCMSCHQSAGVPGVPIVPEAAAWFQADDGGGSLAPVRERLWWFSDVPAGLPASDSQRVATDYSLQLAIGLRRFYVANCDVAALDERASDRGDGRPAAAEVALETCDELANTVVDADSIPASVGPSTPWVLALVAGGFVGGVVLTNLIDRRRERSERSPGHAIPEHPVQREV